VGGFLVFGEILPSPFSAGAEVFKYTTQVKFLGWGLNPVGAEFRGRARSMFSWLPECKIFGRRMGPG